MTNDQNQFQNIKLSGEWEFYWKELLTLSKIKTRSNPDYLEIPSSWNKKIINKDKIGESGFATYRLKILFPESMIGKILSLRLEFHPGAHEVYLNDTLIHKVGKVGKDKASARSVHRPGNGYFTVTSDEMNIIMHFSNYEHRLGGMIRNIYLGTPEEINSITNTQRNYDLFSISVLFIIALYYFFFWFIRKNERSSILFSFLCLILMLRALTQNQQILREIFPEGNYKLFLLIEFSILRKNNLNQLFLEMLLLKETPSILLLSNVPFPVLNHSPLYSVKIGFSLFI